MQASTWDRLQEIHFRQAGYRCEICDGIGPTHPVELHEIWHYDDDQHIQRLDGLIALCPRCHQVKHIGRMLRTPQLPAILEHFARVNVLSMTEATDRIRQALRQHQARSKHAWILDISWLRRRHGIELDAAMRESRARW